MHNGQKRETPAEKKLAQFTRYGTIVLGLIQATGLAIGFNNIYRGLVINPSAMTYAMIAIVLTAGTAFLMWLGEQITEKGIGNGISILIFAGIAAAIPRGIQQIYQTQIADAGSALFLNIVKVLIILVFVVLIIVGVIFIQQGVRKIPVQYAKRVVGRKMYGGQSTHIPLKVNAAGVIPVIFCAVTVGIPPDACKLLERKCCGRLDYHQHESNGSFRDGPICDADHRIHFLLYICTD